MKIKEIGVIGAGIMGNGIAQVCAVNGVRVNIVDVSESSVARGLASIASNLDRLVKKDKLTEAASSDAMARVSGTTDYSTLSSADLVIEAATENLGLKLRILSQVSEVVSDNTLIATNTSSISITELAASVGAPERFIGLHFFNPVPLMLLVEVIGGLETSDRTRERALEFVKAIGKTPIEVRNSPGFAVNRILVPMINEAVFTLQEGLASAQDIDTGMTLGCNQPIGPLALADLIGLDTLLAVMEMLSKGFDDPKYRPAPLLKEMVAAGRLGRKSGRGFYSY